MKPIVRLIITLVIALVMTILLTLLVSAQSPNPAGPVTLPEVGVVVTSLGGEMVDPSGHVTVTFAPGAVHEPVTVTLSFDVSQVVPDRLGLVSAIFAVKAWGLISIPMTITIHYVLPAGDEESDLVMAYFDQTINKWLPLPTTVDAVRYTATAHANQLTSLALVRINAIQPPPGSVAVVDDQDSGFVRHGAELGWHSVTGSSDYYYLGHMYWTSNTYSVEDNWATWTPTLITGSYRVLVFIPYLNSTTQNAHYRVVHNGQVADLVVEQEPHWAEWVDVGVYDFGSDAAGNYIRLSDVTGEANLTKYVGFDAVAFVPNKVYLPLVIKNYPPLPPLSPKKQWTGIHLGNRSLDWNNPTDFLALIDGGSPDQPYPASVVILSNQVYEIERSSVPPCEITGVITRADRAYIYQYLKQAAQAGVEVIIRLYPSPGNFLDWYAIPGASGSGWMTHTLLSGYNTPSGTNYCLDGWSDPVTNPDDGKYVPMDYFRSADDLVREMHFIHETNRSNGWAEFGFIPANEPNIEWYKTESRPQIWRDVAWQAMNAYFVSLYDHRQQEYPSEFRIFTPPMAQANYAELVDIEDPSCTLMQVRDRDGNSAGAGYTHVFETYYTKNDGVAWHNYFIQYGESMAPCHNGWHVSNYFPFWMTESLTRSQKVGIVAESDLCSPNQCRGQNPLTAKGADRAATASSLRQFFQNEFDSARAKYITAWLLNNNFPGNSELDWHEAYQDDGAPRSWFFDLWWSKNEREELVTGGVK